MKQTRVNHKAHGNSSKHKNLKNRWNRKTLQLKHQEVNLMKIKRNK